MDNEKVKKGIQIFGGILVVVCLVLGLYSAFGPGANTPLTSEEEKKMQEVHHRAFNAPAPSVDTTPDAGLN
jgi:hypothetical protein